MRTVRQINVMEGIARLDGVDPNSGSWTAEYVGKLVEFMNERVKEAIHFEFWPEWTVAERRAFRPIWDSNLNYQAGDEVYHEDEDAYYVCNADTVGVGQDPADDVEETYWSPVGDEFQLYVPPETAYTTTRTVYRAEWAAGTTYAEGDEVWLTSSATYYRAVAASTGEDPSGDVTETYWEDIEIAAQAMDVDLDPIGEVCGVFLRNPFYTTNAHEYDFMPTADGWAVPSGPNYPWVMYRQRPPVFTSTAWSSATSYVRGDLAYYSGDSWKALGANANSEPGDNSSDWERVRFPYVVEAAVKRLTYADLLRENGEQGKALAEEIKAEDWLEDARDTALASQKQWDRVQVKTWT